MTPAEIAAETVFVVPHPTGTAVAWGPARIGPDGKPQYAEHPFFQLQANEPPERLAQMERELRKIVEIAIERGMKGAYREGWRDADASAHIPIRKVVERDETGRIMAIRAEPT